SVGGVWLGGTGGVSGSTGNGGAGALRSGSDGKGTGIRRGSNGSGGNGGAGGPGRGVPGVGRTGTIRRRYTPDVMSSKVTTPLWPLSSCTGDIAGPAPSHFSPQELTDLFPR